MRKSINEITHWEPVEVFGKRCVFTPERVDRVSLPEGFYMYECRSYDDDWGLCCQIALGIFVNFFGTIISNEPIPVDFELYELYVRNGDDNDGNKVIDGAWDIEWIDEWGDYEIEEYEPIARSFDEYQHSTIKSSWNIPDECKCMCPGILYIDKFDDETKDKIFDATTLILSDNDETKNHYPKFEIIIDIKSMNAKQINQIREIMYHVRSLYEERSSMYEQERIVFTRTKSIDQLIKEVKEEDD